MSVSAAHFKEVTNGYEKRSDGLWVHKGKADIGSARITNYLPPTTGAGLELEFVPTPTATATSYIQSYDRDASQWRDLNLRGLNVILSPQTGGAVQMPNGTITGAMIADGTVQTADLADNAAQQYLGGYFATPTWSNSTTGYVETPAQVSVSLPAGATGMLRFECSGTIYNSAAPSYSVLGFGWNGVVQANMLGVASVGTANYPQPFAFTYYIGAPGYAGVTTRFALFIAASGGGTTTIHPAGNLALYATHQKK